MYVEPYWGGPGLVVSHHPATGPWAPPPVMRGFGRSSLSRKGPAPIGVPPGARKEGGPQPGPNTFPLFLEKQSVSFRSTSAGFFTLSPRFPRFFVGLLLDVIADPGRIRSGQANRLAAILQTTPAGQPGSHLAGLAVYRAP